VSTSLAFGGANAALVFRRESAPVSTRSSSPAARSSDRPESAARRWGVPVAAGRPLASEVDASAGYRRDGGAREAGLVPQLDLTAWLPAGQADG
jgi:hypothetical protein